MNIIKYIFIAVSLALAGCGGYIVPPPHSHGGVHINQHRYHHKQDKHYHKKHKHHHKHKHHNKHH